MTATDQVVSPTSELQMKALTHVQRMSSLTIADQATYDTVVEQTRGLAALDKEIEGHYAPLKQAAFESHRKICAAEKGMRDPVQAALTMGKQKLLTWTTEQQRIQRQREEEARAEAERIRREEEARIAAERQRLEQEARARAEEERLANAIQAESEGASAVEVEHMLNAPVAVQHVPMSPPPPPPVVVVAPTYQHAAGISKPRDNWKARVINKQLLIEAAAKDSRLSHYLEVDQSMLDKLAKIEKQSLSVPGVQAYNDPNISVRRA